MSHISMAHATPSAPGHTHRRSHRQQSRNQLLLAVPAECKCSDVHIKPDSCARAYIKGSCNSCNTLYIDMYGSKQIFPSDFSKKVAGLWVREGCNVTVFDEEDFKGNKRVVYNDLVENFSGEIQSYRCNCGDVPYEAKAKPVTPDYYPPLVTIPRSLDDVVKMLRENEYQSHPGLHAAYKSLRRGRSSRNAYIMLLGTTGSGKSSTINLLFDNPNITLVGGMKSTTDAIHEFRIKLPVDELGIENSELRVIDTPGLGDTDGLDKDARFLATLDEFLSSHSELRNRKPNVVLIFHNFADNRFDGRGSKFVSMIKALEHFRDRLTDKTYSNIVFVLTHFCSVTKQHQRRPDKLLSVYKSVIENHSFYSKPILLSVAENMAREQELPMMNGYFKLPNNEFYPRNLYDKLDLITNNGGDLIGRSVFRTAFRNSDYFNITSHTMPLLPSNNSSFMRYMQLLIEHVVGVNKTEVSDKLNQAYQTMNETLKRTFPDTLYNLQKYFNLHRIHTVYQVPRTTPQILKLYQAIRGNEASTYLLNTAFSLRTPTFKTSIAGYSYNVMNDRALTTSPFDMSPLQPSDLGYLIPQVLTCNLEQKITKHCYIVNSKVEYIEQRMKNLGIAGSVVAHTSFRGSLKPGYNIKKVSFTNNSCSLSAAQEFRLFQFTLSSNTLPFATEFEETVRALLPYNESDYKNVETWRQFFQEYGTHVVQSVHGGGEIQISVTSDQPFDTGVVEVLFNLINFSEDMPIYTGNETVANHTGLQGARHSLTFYGGNPQYYTHDLTKLSVENAVKLLENWRESLRYNPVMLKTEMQLVPLSQIVKELGHSYSAEIERATFFLLNSSLTYNPPPRNGSGEPGAPRDELMLTELLQQLRESNQRSYEFTMQIREMQKENEKLRADLEKMTSNRGESSVDQIHESLFQSNSTVGQPSRSYHQNSGFPAYFQETEDSDEYEHLFNHHNGNQDSALSGGDDILESGKNPGVNQHNSNSHSDKKQQQDFSQAASNRSHAVEDLPGTKVEKNSSGNYTEENDDNTPRTAPFSSEINSTDEYEHLFNHHNGSSEQHSVPEDNVIESRNPEPLAAAAPVIPSITIAVMGRSGSGVTSTIRELIGPNRTCSLPEGEESLKDILEYTLSPPASAENQYKIKLVDIPGFIDGRVSDQDSQILASLKSYIQSNGFPTFYLALSRFDDNRFDGEHSLFVRFLKRVQLFRKVLNVTADNTVFLLTRLMSETKSTQPRPDSKINVFRTVIEQYTDTFPVPLHILVGENKAVGEYEVAVEQGYSKLPNRQLYPKNIFEMLKSIASNASTGDEHSDDNSTVHQTILTSVLGSREQKMRCSARLVSTDWDFYDGDADDFAYLMEHDNIVITNPSEVNTEIESVFRNRYDNTMQLQGAVQKLVLQLRLQRYNITRKSELPVSMVDRARFFQTTQITPGFEATLLKLAFGLKIPEYIKPLTVGFGYDLVDDEKSNVSPFKSIVYVPSSVGYELPEFMTCRKYSQPEVAFVKAYSKTYQEYVTERLKFLDFPGRDTKNLTAFKAAGKLREGYNMEPEESENVVTLSSVKEVRTLVCFLSRPSIARDHLNDDFVKAVDAMTAFDEGNRDSVNWWNNFFSTYGSHIVTKGYGGGNIYGSLVGQNVRRLLESQPKIDEALNSILDFTPFSEGGLESPTYRLFGGEIDAQTSRLYDLNETTRNELLSRWENSLSADFEMLSSTFDLQPMSTIVMEIDEDKGRQLEVAIGLRLAGKLEFKRKGKPSTSGTNNGTRKPPKKLTAPRLEYNGVDNHGTNQGGQHQHANRTSTPSRTTWSTRRPSVSHNQNIGFPAFGGTGEIPESDANQILIDQLNNANATVGMLEDAVAESRRKANERHREDQERFNRHREEQERLAQERNSRLNQTVRENEENVQRFYTDHINQINEQSRRDQEEWERRMEEIRKQAAEDELQHQQLLAKIERERKAEEKRREGAEISCSGLKFFKCVGTVVTRPFSMGSS